MKKKVVEALFFDAPPFINYNHPSLHTHMLNGTASVRVPHSDSPQFGSRSCTARVRTILNVPHVYLEQFSNMEG